MELEEINSTPFNIKKRSKLSPKVVLPEKQSSENDMFSESVSREKTPMKSPRKRKGTPKITENGKKVKLSNMSGNKNEGNTNVFQKSLSKSAQRRLRCLEKVNPEQRSCTIIVSNISLDTKKQELKKYFSNFGKIKFIKDRKFACANIKKSKNGETISNQFHPNADSKSCFIIFEKEDSAKQAFKTNGKLFKGSHLNVDLIQESNDYNPRNAIFVGNIPFNTSEEDLWTTFSSCGVIESVRLVRDKRTGVGKGCAYVNFAHKASAKLALQMEDVQIKNRTLRIKKISLLKDKNDLEKDENTEENNVTLMKPEKKKAIQDRSKCIFVRNLPYQFSEEDLSDVFAACGKIESVTLARFKKTGIGRGYGYVNFESLESVELALQMNDVQGRNGPLKITKLMTQDITKNEKDEKKIGTPKQLKKKTKSKESKKSDGKIKSKENKPIHDSNKSIFVRNFPSQTSDEDLREAFSSCGKIESIKLVQVKKTCIGKGYAYVNFESLDSVMLALQMDDVYINDSKISIISMTDIKDKTWREMAKKTKNLDETKVIFVGNLSLHDSDKVLWETFSSCGKIESVIVIRGNQKGFGCVQFENSDSVELALQMENIYINNCKIYIIGSLFYSKDKKRYEKSGNKRNPEGETKNKIIIKQDKTENIVNIDSEDVSDNKNIDEKEDNTLKKSEKKKRNRGNKRPIKEKNTKSNTFLNKQKKIKLGYGAFVKSVQCH